MNNRSDGSATGMDVVDGCLVVPVGGNVDPDMLTRLGKEVLARVQATRIKRVIINIASIKMMDSYTFTIFKNTNSAIAMLGATPVFVGIRPGVASALVDLDMDLDGILTAVTTEDAFELLKHRTPGPTQPEAEDEERIEASPESDGFTEEAEDG